MRVLVTGGGGFLGTSICLQLEQLGFEVLAYQRGAAEHFTDHSIHVIQGDICDYDALEEAATGCDAIIHTAGKAGVWGKAEDYYRINVVGTQTVVNVCQDLSIPVMVHTSSPSIAHGHGDVEGGDESLPVGPPYLAAYPASKAEAEKLALQANSSQLKTTALRPHLIWGPGDPHILPRLASKVRSGRLALPGADKKIDTVFVENAAYAHVLALQDLLGDGKSAGKAYFISNDEPLPQGVIIKKLLAAINIEVEIRPVSSRVARFIGTVCETIWSGLGIKSEPPLTRFSADQLCTAHWYNISAAKRELGYKARISIDQGLEKLHQSVTAD